MLDTSICDAYESGMKRSNNDLRTGMDWLDEDAESPIERAEAEAALAFAAVERGDLPQAQYYADLACKSEADEYNDSPTWRPFLLAIEKELARLTASVGQ